MSRRAKREEKVKSKIFSKLIVVAIFLGLVFFILKVAPNYVNDEITDKANLVINNSNVTRDLKKDLIIEDGIIYVAKEDIENFFDSYIYYDEKYNQIITTSGNQVTSMVIGEEYIVNNLKHTVTIFNVEGAFLEKRRKVLLSVIPKRDYYKLTEGIKLIDPKVFFVVEDAYEVKGGK